MLDNIPLKNLAYHTAAMPPPPCEADGKCVNFEICKTQHLACGLFAIYIDKTNHRKIHPKDHNRKPCKRFYRYAFKGVGNVEEVEQPAFDVVLIDPFAEVHKGCTIQKLEYTPKSQTETTE